MTPWNSKAKWNKDLMWDSWSGNIVDRACLQSKQKIGFLRDFLLKCWGKGQLQATSQLARNERKTEKENKCYKILRLVKGRVFRVDRWSEICKCGSRHANVNESGLLWGVAEQHSVICLCFLLFVVFCCGLIGGSGSQLTSLSRMLIRIHQASLTKFQRLQIIL